MFIYLELPDLPQPPQKFIDKAYELVNTVDIEKDNTILGTCYQSDYLTRKLIKNGVEMNSRVQHGYDMGDDWESWVKENIISEYIETSVRLSVGEDTTEHGPHCDNPDKWKLYYLIDYGVDGENAVTSFYYDVGKPLEITGNTCDDGHYYVNDIDRLIPVYQAKFPLGKWIILNGLILHGVQNAGIGRLNFQVSIEPNSAHFNFIGK